MIERILSGIVRVTTIVFPQFRNLIPMEKRMEKDRSNCRWSIVAMWELIMEKSWINDNFRTRYFSSLSPLTIVILFLLYGNRCSIAISRNCCNCNSNESFDLVEIVIFLFFFFFFSLSSNKYLTVFIFIYEYIISEWWNWGREEGRKRRERHSKYFFN